MPTMSHALHASLSLLARLAARAHDAVFAPPGRSPDAAGSNRPTPSTAPAPLAGDPDGAMDYRHGCRDVARAYEELRDAARRVHAHDPGPPPADVRALLELRPDPPRDAREERRAVERGQRRHQRDHGVSWLDGARQRPAATLAPAEMHRLLTAIGTLVSRIDAALDHRDDDGGALDAVRRASRHLDSAQTRWAAAAGAQRRQPKAPPRCANDPCPNAKRERGAECDACARYRQRHRQPRPIPQEVRT